MQWCRAIVIHSVPGNQQQVYAVDQRRFIHLTKDYSSFPNPEFELDEGSGRGYFEDGYVTTLE